MKIRIPARVVGFLTETQTAYNVRAGEADNDPADLVEVIRAVQEAPTLADGGVSIEATRSRLAVLREYGDYLVVAASDNASDGDMSAMAEVNAGRAMVRRVDLLWVRVAV